MKKQEDGEDYDPLDAFMQQNDKAAGVVAKKEEDEEVDPLDAFMAGVQTEVRTIVACNHEGMSLREWSPSWHTFLTMLGFMLWIPGVQMKKEETKPRAQEPEKPQFLDDVSDDDDDYVPADGLRRAGGDDDDYDSDAEVRQGRPRR